MKKLLIVAMMAMFAACNTATDTAKPAGTDTTMQANVVYPYDIMYSSKFVIDDPKNAQTVLTLWKDFDNGNLLAHKEMFADTIDLHFADGSILHSNRDSALAGGQSYRNTLASAVNVINAVMAVKSTDKNEHWALVWGMEKDVDKKGKTDSFYVQETWRFNDAGKADLMYQFRAEGEPPKK
jgi:hypothetical protein